MSKTGKTVPWAAMAVYLLAEKWDRFFSRVSNMTYWRFRWLDYWCNCERCQGRRASGQQKKGWKKG